MNQKLENERLRRILLDAAAAEFAQELDSTEQVPVSFRFQRQMQLMVNNPNKWAKRKKEPVWTQVVKYAAVIVLTCSLAFGTTMAISPTARAAVVEWVTEWYENSVLYRFFGEASFEDMPKYQVTELPPDYYDTGMPLELPNSIELIYENSVGEIMRFEYMRVEDGSALIINTDNMEIFDIAIGHSRGHLYISQDPQQSSAITWYDEKSGLQFLIDGFFEKEQLIDMANSVSLVE